MPKPVKSKQRNKKQKQKQITKEKKTTGQLPSWTFTQLKKVTEKSSNIYKL